MYYLLQKCCTNVQHSSKCRTVLSKKNKKFAAIKYKSVFYNWYFLSFLYKVERSMPRSLAALL